MKKFILAFAMAAALIISLPVISFADSDYVLSDDGKTLIEYTGKDEVVTIPDGVETIGSTAFYNNEDIKKIVMPDSVKHIENQAFRYCSEVTEIKWSGNLETIEYGAFEGMRSMRYILLPDCITRIDEYNFSDCTKLEYIRLPENITEIGSESFSGNPVLRSVVVPDSVSVVNKKCFRNNHDDFVIVTGAGSAAEEYAAENSIKYSTKGVEVPYTAQSDSNGTLSVTRSGAKLGSSAQIKTGDVLRITAATSLDDLNVTVNGKSINYFFLQKTKNELHDDYYVVTGPIDLKLKSVSQGKDLDQTLNADGGSLRFTGSNTLLTVDEGRRAAAIKEGVDGSISTTVDVKETTYLLFDMKIYWANSESLNVYFRIDDKNEVFDVDRTTTGYEPFAYELSPGTHTISWETYSGYEDSMVRFGLSNVRLTTDLDEVNTFGFSISFPQVDLDIGESLAVEYVLRPEALNGKRTVSWKSSDESVASVSNGVVTGISKGKCRITGTVSGVSESVMVYVSGKSYSAEATDTDVTYDASGLITEKTLIGSDAGDMIRRNRFVHVKGDKTVYMYSGKALYAMDVTEKGAELEKRLTADRNIFYAAARGKTIYLLTKNNYSGTDIAIVGYDTVGKRRTFQRAFDLDGNSPLKFAVDDDENFYFIFNDRDLYAYDKSGNLISKDIQSNNVMSDGIGAVIADQVDPYNYTVLVSYINTVPADLIGIEEYTPQASDIGSFLSFLTQKGNFCGMRRIRNGEVIGSENYIKNIDQCKGSNWTFLDKGNLAVNTNGEIVRFHKDRKSKTGVNYDQISKLYDGFMAFNSYSPQSIMASGSIYVENYNDIIFRVDAESGKVLGSYNTGDEVYALISANDKAYYVGKDSDGNYYAAPLSEETFSPTVITTLRDHITLTYGKDEVEKAFLASQSSTDYSSDSKLYTSKPSWKSPFKAGSLSDKAKSETLARLNYARWQYGINPLTLNEQYMERNQKGAVVMAANNELTHYPEQPAGMDDDFYAEGCKGVGADIDYSGNCSYGDSVYDSVKGYLDDTYNAQEGSIGHRLSMLDTDAVSASFGQAGRYSCMSIYTSSEEKPENNEKYYAWPSAGYFPSMMIDTNAYWHVITTFARVENLTVKLTYKGVVYEADSVNINTNEDYSFVFKIPQNLKKLVVRNGHFADGTEIEVEVSGIFDKKGNEYIVSYPVRFVNSNESSDAADGSGDAANQGGKAFEKGASLEEAEAAIASMTSDSDPQGTVFNKLQLRSFKQTNTSITLSWKKVSGAKTYMIYGNKCGSKNKMKRLAKSTGKTKKFKKILGKKVKKGTYYKFMIVALDKDGKVVSSSRIIHVATKGGKVGNVGKVTTKAKKNKVSIRKGKTFKLKAKQVAANKKLKVKKHRAVKYETTNKEIASVSSKGVIKGKKKGTCYVYAYAQNGVFAKIKVTVK